MPTPPSTTQVVKTTVEFQKALANPAVKNITLDASVGSVGDEFVANHLVNIDLKNRILTGNLTIDTEDAGTLDIKTTGGTIQGNLTVDAENATINNYATASGDIYINNVKMNTWNEFATGNKLTINDPDGITLNVGVNASVDKITVNEVQNSTGTVKVTNEGTISEVDVKAPVTIVSATSIPTTTIANGVVVTVKASEQAPETIVTGTDGTVDLEAAVKLQQATVAVGTAEEAKTDATRTEAQTLVTALGAADVNGALQNRLNAIVTIEDATEAVEGAEEAKTDATRTAAQDLVTALGAADVNGALQERLDSIVTIEDEVTNGTRLKGAATAVTEIAEVGYMSKRVVVDNWNNTKVAQVVVSKTDLQTAYNSNSVTGKGYTNIDGVLKEHESNKIKFGYAQADGTGFVAAETAVVDGLTIDISKDGNDLLLGNTQMTKELFDSVKSEDVARPYTITVVNHYTNGLKEKIAKIEFSLNGQNVVAKLVNI